MVTHYLGISVVALWLGGVIITLGLVLAGIVQETWLADTQH